MLSLSDIEKALLNQPTLGGRVRALLSATGMTQAQLAAKVGTKQQTIAYICGVNGHEATTSRYTIKIAEALGVDSNWLASGEGNPIPTKQEIEDRNLVSVQVFLGDDDVVSHLNGVKAQPVDSLLTSLGAHGKTFAIRALANGCSRCVTPGDDLLFDTSIPPRPGQTVLVIVDRSSVLLGRYQRTESGESQVVTLTPDWPDVMKIGGAVEVAGVLVEHRHYGALAA
jgi:transcriptional regulator with XRE-family HTH domain